MSSEEVEFFRNNIGEVIQNLGFMSTSLNKETAFMFTKNLFIEIEVDDLPRKE